MVKGIILEMKDGRKIPNEPGFGLNLSNPDEIMECLEVTGRYRVYFGDSPWCKVVSVDEVARVYAEEGTENG